MSNLPKIIDSAAYLILFVNMALGIWRGFIMEIGNLLGVLISLKVALQFREQAAAYSKSLFPDTAIPHEFLGFFSLLFITWLVLKILLILLTRFLEESKTLTAMNRLLGGCLGGLKGLLILGIVLLPLVSIPVEQLLGEIKANNPEFESSYPTLAGFPKIIDESRVLSSTRMIRDLIFEKLGDDNFMVRSFQKVRRVTVNVSSLRQALNKKPEVVEKLVTDEKIIELARTNPALKSIFEDPQIREIVEKSPKEQVVKSIVSNPGIMTKIMKSAYDLMGDDKVQTVFEQRFDAILAESDLKRQVNKDGSVSIVDSKGGVGVTITQAAMKAATGATGEVKVSLTDAAGNSVDLGWAEEILRTLLRDKATLEKMYASRQFDALQRKNQIREVLSDSQVQGAINSGNYSVLYFNTKVRDLLVDPQVQSFLKSYAASLK